MSYRQRFSIFLLLCLIGIIGISFATSVAGAEPPDRLTNITGTIWVANRGAHTIRGFDATTGEVVATVAMASNSEPGDLAFAKGKLYVAEEFGTPPAIAIVDAETAVVTNRIFLAQGSRPHHVHASRNGKLVSFGMYGTDMVAVVDTQTDTLLGPWDSNPATTNGRVHAAIFSEDGKTLYLASDASGEVIALDPRSGEIFWRMTVPGAHELALTQDDDKAYVSRRTLHMLSVIDLQSQTFTDILPLSLPDTMQVSGNNQLLTVGLRTNTPGAQVAVIDTETLDYELVTIGGTGTIAGHQWTSNNARFTFASFEGGVPSSQGVVLIDHQAGNEVVETLNYPGRPHGVTFAGSQPGSGGDQNDGD